MSNQKETESNMNNRKEKGISNRKFNQLQSWTLPLAYVLMVVGLIVLLFA